MSAPGAILLEPSFDAVRDLARHGVSLVVAASPPGSSAAASRHVSRVERAPWVWAEEFGQWFEALLHRYPGAVVFPGSDELVWRLAAWGRRQPADAYRLAVPSLEAVGTVTVKERLYAACPEFGIATPKTWPAPDASAAREIAESARFPVVVKPQTRVGNLHWGTGQLARDERGLVEAIEWCTKNVRFRPEVTGDYPEIAIPLVQEFIGGRDRPLYHLCGYLSADGDAAILAHRKLLQFPRRFGIGICFETAAVDARLAENLISMLRGIGYHGMFEAEFLERGVERLLIDLNARSYNGMTLELERGLGLHWYRYLEALGERDRLRSELQGFRAEAATAPSVFCRRLEFAAMVAGQTVGGGFSPRESAAWLRWYWRNRRTMVDPFASRSDRRPGRTRLRRDVGRWLRRPKEFGGVYVRRESSR